MLKKQPPKPDATPTPKPDDVARASKSAAAVGGIVLAGLSLAESLRARILSGGYLPDLPDPRDWLAERIFPRGLQLPLSADLRPACPPVEDQGPLGSCTAQAGVGLMEYFDRLPDGQHTDLSRLALYFWEREAMGTVGQDSGATIRDCLKQLAKGVCRESLHPYDIAKYMDPPGPEACADRPNHRVTDYYRVPPLRQQYMAKAALARGLPVICGIRLYESALTEAAAKTGAVPYPSWTDAPVGGHAVLLTGYDDLLDTFAFRNSWGGSWGDAGYGTLPQRYAANPKLCSDMWVARKTNEV